MSYDQYPTQRPTSGWVIFAGSMVAITALANLIYGMVLLVNDEWIVLAPRAAVTFDLTTVGVIYLLFTSLKIFVAIGIFNGHLWARILGIISAALNLLAHFAFMSIYSVYPVWSWLVIILNGLIIYGLAIHGDEVAEL